MAVEKLCWACFFERFPGKHADVVTWGRQCSRCKKDTPSKGTLVKVETHD